MFRPPTKYSEYLQDVRKSIDYILKRVNATTVTQIVAGTNVTISPASGTGVVTINSSGGGGGGLPAGGTAGQILSKINSVDYNAEWIDNYALWTSTLKHEVKASENINKGQAVYVSTADGTNMIVSKASNTSEATSSKTMGLLAQNLATNGKGFVITEGLLAGLNTSGASAGDPVWLGANGDLIFGLINKPYAPLHLVSIGIVTRVNSNNGEIFVKVQNGFELDELHNVDARFPNNNDGIFYNSTTQLWEHKPVSAVYTTPTLAQVTTAGNTTTNNITVGTLYFGNGNHYLVTDNSTYAMLSSNRTLQLATSGNPVLSVFTTQNVAIGTTTDAGYKLDVNGTSRFQSSVTNTSGGFISNLSSPSSDAFYTFISGAIGFYTSHSYTKTQKLNLTNAVGLPSAPNNVLAVSGSITAASAIARGVYFNNTLVAAANNDVLVGLDINPTFTNGAFTGVSNLALRIAYVAGRYISFTQRPGYTDYGRIQFTNVTGADITSSGSIALTPGDGNLTLSLGNGLTSKITTPGSTKYDSYGNQTPSTLAGTTNRPVLFTSTIPDGSIDGFIFENTSSGSRNLFKIIQNNTTLFIVNPNGNVLVGTTTDAGAKVQIKGSGNTSATTSLLVQNSSSVDLLRVGDSGDLTLGTFASGLGRIVVTCDPSYGIKTVMLNNFGGLIIRQVSTDVIWFGGQLQAGLFATGLMNLVAPYITGNNPQGNTTASSFNFRVTGSPYAQTPSTASRGVLFDGGFGFQSGGFANYFELSPTYTFDISNGRIVRGIYYNPTLVTPNTNDKHYGIQTTLGGAYINTTTPNSSAALQADSTTQGFLQPRMTNAQALAITTPATGLQVYDTTNNKNLLYNGTLWQNVATESWVSAQGYLTSQPWVVSGSNIYYNTGSVGIGTVPSYPLHISSAAAANIFGTVQSTNANGTAAWVAFNDQSDNVVYRVFGSGASGTQMGIPLARTASLIANLGGTGKFLLGTFSNTDFILGTGNAEKMRIVDSTGNILIGTTTDLGNKLQVNGTIDATGYKVNNTAGYTGTLVIVTNPPGQQNIDIRGGIVVNIF